MELLFTTKDIIYVWYTRQNLYFLEIVCANSTW